MYSKSILNPKEVAVQSGFENRSVSNVLKLSPLKPVLKVKGLNVAYGSKQVLFDVNYDFTEKKVTAVMGPSGCGKSTFIKVLNRTFELLSNGSILSGSVLLNGNDIYRKYQDPKIIRKRMGIIHQQPVMFPMSIINNLLFGAKFHKCYSRKVKYEYAQSFLEKVGLLDEVKDRLNEPAQSLSGGQQQRLCLARTLANQPELVLMDEPCSALDPGATQKIEKLIQQLKKDYTIIIVTHNMGQAKRVSDNSLMMFNGQLVEHGQTSEIFSNPKTEIMGSFANGAIS